MPNTLRLIRNDNELKHVIILKALLVCDFLIYPLEKFKGNVKFVKLWIIETYSCYFGVLR